MRVIAGYLGGRTLVAPHGPRTRPTSDRVREALFSILGDVRGLRVLDLYAGTGALGIEALSRGAAQATFVEHAREPLRALRQNLRDLGLEGRTRVLPIRVERALGGTPPAAGDADLVFVDPPYAALRAKEVLDALGLLLGGDDPVIVRRGGRVVLEHAAKLPPPAWPGLLQGTARRYGDTALSFYLRRT